MLFFWSIYDGIISYLVPVLFTNQGYSATIVGLLISISAISGAFFDFVISKLVRAPHYLRMFFFLFVVSLCLPLFLWSNSSLWIYAIAMMLWGLSYDILNFGVLDLSPRISLTSEHTKNISIIGSFKTIGYFIGPPLVAHLINLSPNATVPVAVPYLFLIIAIVIYVILFSLSPRTNLFRTVNPIPGKNIHLLRELFNWQKLGKILLPVLIFNSAFYIFEATFWTLGPIYSQQFPDSQHFSLLFMAVYILPTIIVTQFAENISQHFGKKKTAYTSFIVSNLFLIPLGITSNPLVILGLIFISTIAGALAWSAISGAFVDYLAESVHLDSDIIGLKDFSANLGYIMGPILSGIISDLVGISSTFAILGIFNVLLILFLFTITPRHITIPQKVEI